MKQALKRIEWAGRRVLVGLCALLFGLRPRAVTLVAPPGRALRLLVVRLDERVGNAILLTPLLRSLKAIYPEAELDVLVARRAVPILAGLPELRCIIPFNKRDLWGPSGIFRTLWMLRKRSYDLALDAANPTNPSLTHAMLVRGCGASHSVGSDQGSFGRLYSAPVALGPQAARAHEIDLRLALLSPLAHGPRWRDMAVSDELGRKLSAPLTAFVQELGSRPFVVINVGARLADKQLRAADYAVIANMVTVAGLTPVLTFGPAEQRLAAEVHNFSAACVMAPPSTLDELAALMRRSLCVVSCDTGPMHLAVALGRPTCGLFISTDPQRYGHSAPPHTVIDVRAHTQASWRAALRAFVLDQRARAQAVRPTPSFLAEELTPLLVDAPRPSDEVAPA